MLSESISTLESYKHYHDLLQRSGELVNFNGTVQNELLNIYRAEVDANYHYNRSCGECVKEFLNKIYQWYNQNK
jgi:hypothetical protein